MSTRSHYEAALLKALNARAVTPGAIMAAATLVSGSPVPGALSPESIEVSIPDEASMVLPFFGETLTPPMAEGDPAPVFLGYEVASSLRG